MAELRVLQVALERWKYWENGFNKKRKKDVVKGRDGEHREDLDDQKETCTD